MNLDYISGTRLGAVPFSDDFILEARRSALDTILLQVGFEKFLTGNEVVSVGASSAFFIEDFLVGVKRGRSLVIGEQWLPTLNHCFKGTGKLVEVNLNATLGELLGNHESVGVTHSLF